MLSAPVAQAAGVIAVPGGEIRVEYARDPGTLDPALLLGWVRHSADAIVAYYGHFPVQNLRIVVMPASGRGIGGGRTWADGGARIRIRVGEMTTTRDYENDWVLVHEMTHLALPSLPHAQEWFEEGLATYVEPLARAQAGLLSPQDVWTGFLRGMPNGLPQPGDQGLDRTHTWGRTYWGGALFCLQADLEIRRRTENRRGLRDALRAILALGNMETSSGIEPLLVIGDRAVGVPVLSALYARLKNDPGRSDLDAMWRQLGVVPTGDSVQLNDAAPEAAIRRAMTAPPAA